MAWERISPFFQLLKVTEIFGNKKKQKDNVEQDAASS
jgi:hypothetical protein